jgi:hypothetical protein
MLFVSANLTDVVVVAWPVMDRVFALSRVGSRER